MADIACVVAPVLHKYVDDAVDVSVTLPPLQKVVGPPAVITGTAGNAFTVTLVDADAAVQPLTSAMTTL